MAFLIVVTLRYFIFLKPWFETKNRFLVKPKHKVTLKFWFQTKFKTILIAETKVWFQTKR